MKGGFLLMTLLSFVENKSHVLLHGCSSLWMLALVCRIFRRSFAPNICMLEGGGGQATPFLGVKRSLGRKSVMAL